MNVFGMSSGGFLYEDETAPVRAKSRIAYLPALSVLPLVQHVGKPARACVNAGDYILEGMVVGVGEGPLSGNVHASVPGRVLKTLNYQLHDGRSTSALVVRLEGAFEKLGKRVELFPWNSISPAEIQRIISDKGVVELEEPGRPLADVIRKSRTASRRNTLVLNAVFDDPWLAADYAVLSERTLELAEALAIMMKTAVIGRCVVAVCEKDLPLAVALASHAKAFSLNLELLPVHGLYPQHNREELRKTVELWDRHAKREPSDLVIVNSSTLGAVFDAVRLNKPLMERYVAVGGAVVKRPSVLRVRLGTRIGDLIAECGGFVEEVKRLIVGSPLTGYTISDLDVPVTKTTTAIVALNARQIRGTKQRACMACGDCRSVCPVRLDPERLYKLSLRGDLPQAKAEGSDACQACACCSAVCPSRLPLMTMIRHSSEKGA